MGSWNWKRRQVEMQKILNVMLRNEGFIPHTVENHQKILRKRDMWFRKSVVPAVTEQNISSSWAAMGHWKAMIISSMGYWGLWWSSKGERLKKRRHGTCVNVRMGNYWQSRSEDGKIGVWSQDDNVFFQLNWGGNSLNSSKFHWCWGRFFIFHLWG